MSRPRPRDAVVLVLLFLSAAALLVTLARLPETPPLALAVAPAPAPTPAPAPPSAPEPTPDPTPTSPTAAPPTAAAPTPTPTPAPAASAPAPTPMPTPTPPGPAPDQGRCAEPAFRSLARSIVRDCERACKKDESPLVALKPGDFEALFGRPDDPGVATHFAFFGCTRWSSDGSTCRGFDSAIADPDLCPPTSKTCVRDATSLEGGLTAFLDQHKDAHTVLLFGTASKTGNDGSTMSPGNARLAEARAHAVAELVHAWRRQHQKRDLRVLSVALDNTRTDYWQSQSLRDLVISHSHTRSIPFDTSQPDAANRSVMVVAITCPGLR